MAFRKSEIVPVLLGRGMVAGEADPKLSDAPSYVKNGVFRRAGAVDKRRGTETVRGSSASPGMFTLDGNVYRFGNGLRLEGDNGSTQMDSVTGLDDVTNTILAGSGTSATHFFDATKRGSVIAVAYATENGDGTFDSVIKTFSADTMVQLDSQDVSTASNLQRVSMAWNPSDPDYIYAAWVPSGTTPNYTTIDPDGIIASVTSVTALPTAASSKYAAAVLYDGTGYDIWFAYELSSAVQLVVGSGAGDYDTYTTTTYSNDLTAFSICQWGTSEACVTFVDAPSLATGLYGAKVDLSTPTVSTVTSVDSGGFKYTSAVVAMSATSVDIWYTELAGVNSTTTNVEYRTLDKSATVGSAVTVTESGRLCSNAFIKGSYSAAVLSLGNTTAAGNAGTDASGAVVDSTGVIHAGFNHQLMQTYSSGPLPSAMYDENDATLLYTGTVREAGVNAESVGAFTEIDFLPEYPVVQIRDGVAYFPGSQPRYYDGATLGHCGFLHAPTLSATNKGTGDKLTSGILYGYKACFARTDARGHRWFGPMSNLATFTSNGTDGSLTIGTHHGTPYDDIEVIIYRTLGDLSGSHYEVGRAATSASDVDYTDQVRDSSISDEGYPKAYTDSRYSYAPWPSHRVSGFAKGRYWIAPRDSEKDRVWYSNRIVQDAAINFNGSYVELPEHGGRVTGIVEYLDKVIVFKETAIYAIEGEGLESDGSGVDYSRAYVVDATTGCINPRAISRHDLSIMFLSDRGVYSLTPKFAPEPVGSPVKYYTDNNTVVSMHTMQETSEVVVTTASESLVYNYRFDTWSVWSAHDCVASAFDGDDLWWIDSSGNLKKQNADTRDGTDSWIELQIVSPWMHTAGAGGYKRVKTAQVIGQNISDSIVNCEFGFDLDPEFTQDDFSYETSALNNSDWSDHLDGTDKGATYIRSSLTPKMWPKRTRCSSVRLKVYDAPPAGWDGSGDPGNGASFSSVSFEVLGVPGANRQNDRSMTKG